MTRIAIMQPYFAPYAGYYRLLEADVFVVLDCVQFPRRGWVHRNRFTSSAGDLRWFTLPLQHAPQESLITEMRFIGEPEPVLRRSLRAFPCFDAPGEAQPLVDALLAAQGSLADYLVAQLEQVRRLLGYATPIIRASSLELTLGLKGQDRLIDIARRLGATHYVNAPNGRSLYEAGAFARHNIRLEFLQPYAGPSSGIIERIAREGSAAVAQEIRRNTSFES